MVRMWGMEWDLDHKQQDKWADVIQRDSTGTTQTRRIILICLSFSLFSLDVSRPQRVLLLQSLGIKSSRRETHKTTRIIQGRQWKWKISRGEEKVGRRKMMKGILVGIDFYSWQSILLFLSLSTPWQWLKVGSDLFSRLLQTFTPPAPSPCLISISILVLKNRWANEYKREWRGRVNPLREWSWKRHDNRRRRTWDKKR